MMRDFGIGVMIGLGILMVIITIGVLAVTILTP